MSNRSKKILILLLLITIITVSQFNKNEKNQNEENILPIVIESFKIESCESISTWKTAWGNKPTLTNINTEGNYSLKISGGPLGTGCYFETNEPLNISGYHLEFDIYVENITNLNSIIISLYEEDHENHFYYNTLTTPNPLDTGWNRLHLAKANFRYTGNSDISSWERIKRIRVSVVAEEDANSTIYIDNLHAVKDYSTGIVTLRFDDSCISHYTEAYNRMKKYGYAGVAATITGAIQEQRTTVLCLSDLQEMQDSGWDIISHCYSKGGRLDTKTIEEQKFELSESKSWLISNGFQVGSEYIALPNHAWSNEIIELVKEYYSICMTHTKGHEVLLPSDIHKIIVMPIQRDTQVDEIKGWIDDCLTYDTWLILLFHDIEAPDQYTDCDPEMFQEILDYLYEKQVPVKTISQVFNQN